MKSCEFCGRANQTGLVCNECSKPVEQPGLNDFEALGMGPRLGIDEAELTRLFFALNRLLHPDFFHDASVREQHLSMQNAARLNVAYRRLKSREGRIRAFVEAVCGPLDLSTWKPSTALLMEVMEWNEVLEEGEGEEGGSGRFSALEAELNGRREALLTHLEERVATAEAGQLKVELLDIAGQLQYVHRTLEKLRALS